MCGLAGLVCADLAHCSQNHSKVVTQMCDIQSHRGPDDDGVVSLGRTCLGSNRLSIIDLTSAGHMPMSDQDENHWITYNGEIYNFQELRDELVRCGHSFRSQTDTEVVLQAFKQWGEDCFDRFIGMFAIAIYDRAADHLVMARDRFGKKPLYYTQRNEHVLFASELKALTKVCGKPEINRQRLTEWSLYRNVDFGSQDTLFWNVFALPAGHLLEVKNGVLGTARPYYVLESNVVREIYERSAKLSQRELVEEIESLMLQGVRDRLVSDVPLGTLCSGGVDSSLITALCARDRQDLMAFNVSITDNQVLDEHRYAQRVADHLGISLLTFRADGEGFRRNLARTIYHSDYPLTHPNSVFFLLISEFARSHGVSVLLSGEGADELFGGYVQRYRRYRQYKYLESFLARMPAPVRRIISLAGYAADNVPITEFSEHAGLLAHTTHFIDRFARTELRARSMEAYNFVADEAERGVLGGMLADMTNFLTPLLRRLDRMSMAASVECRVPFLDHRLVHAVSNLPSSYRLRGRTDKWLLKQIAASYLPDQIVYRKKVGFPLPLADYIAPLADEKMFHDGFCLNYLGMHQQDMKDLISNWQQNINGFFNLLSLEIWGRLFFTQCSLEEMNEQIMSVSNRFDSSQSNHRSAR